MRTHITIGLLAAIGLPACSNGGGAYDDAAEMRPDLMTFHPAQARPGELVELTYPRSTQRGVLFVLERGEGDEWVWTHYLTSAVDGYGNGQPRWGDRDDADYGSVDLAVDGPGPDLILIPPDVKAGRHRVCTANVVENFCAPLEVTD